MRKNKSSLLLSLVAVSSLSLFGCSNQVLDYRNAESNNGVIYAADANEPFTGTVTNVPDIELYQSQDGFTAFGNILGSIAFPGMNWSARAFTSAAISGYCRVSVRKGIIDGKTVCKAPGTDDVGTVMHFKGGLLDGSMEYYDSILSHVKLADAEFEDGVLTGEETIYNGNTGDKAAVLHWENGQLNGGARVWDRQGNLTTDTMYKNGVRVLTEGEKFKIALSQPVALVTPQPTPATSVAPVVPATARAPASSQDDCVSAWIAAYRKERDDPSVIVNADQVDEWKQWCQQGKQAPAN